MGLREVLIIVMVLVIAVILYDGFRRVRMAREGSLKMKIKPSSQSPELDGDPVEYSSELPSGGARLIERQEPAISEDGAVPMLMETIAQENQQAVEEDFTEEQHDLFEQPMVAGDRATDIPVEESSSQVDNRDAPAQEVIIIHLLCQEGEVFHGRQLLQQLLACGMRFGEMNIFHRFSSPSGQGELLFSMANAVEPGTFDIDNMEETETLGVTFFLQLPGPESPVKAFETLVEVTGKLQRELNGDLRDENRSVLTKQTIEHMRNRVQEFVRQQKLSS